MSGHALVAVLEQILVLTIIDSAHWINVVLTSINIEGCRTSRACKKVEFDECTMLARYIAIVVVILI